MDALELMMDERHLDERIERRALVIVDEALQRGHCRFDLTRVLRWDVDDFAGDVVLERGSRRDAKPVVPALEKAEYLDQRAAGDEAVGRKQPVVAELQGVAVKDDLLSGGEIRPLKLKASALSTGTVSRSTGGGSAGMA
jgi:hypothetical protein